MIALFPYLVCKQMTFDFKSLMNLNHVLPMNKKIRYISKCCKRSLNRQPHLKNLSFNQHFVYIISSRPEVFLVKSVLKICSKYTGEHPCRSVISIKLQSSCCFAQFIIKVLIGFKRNFVLSFHGVP